MESRPHQQKVEFREIKYSLVALTEEEKKQGKLSLRLQVKRMMSVEEFEQQALEN